MLSSPTSSSNNNQENVSIVKSEPSSNSDYLASLKQNAVVRKRTSTCPKCRIFSTSVNAEYVKHLRDCQVVVVEPPSVEDNRDPFNTNNTNRPLDLCNSSNQMRLSNSNDAQQRPLSNSMEIANALEALVNGSNLPSTPRTPPPPPQPTNNAASLLKVLAAGGTNGNANFDFLSNPAALLAMTSLLSNANSFQQNNSARPAPNATELMTSMLASLGQQQTQASQPQRPTESKCPVCPDTFQSSQALSDHFMLYHATERERYNSKCLIRKTPKPGINKNAIPQSLYTAGSTNSREIISGVANSNDPENLIEFKCNFCQKADPRSNTVITGWAALQTHFGEMHHNEWLYSCYFCADAGVKVHRTKWLSDMRAHLKEHSALLPTHDHVSRAVQRIRWTVFEANNANFSKITGQINSGNSTNNNGAALEQKVFKRNYLCPVCAFANSEESTVRIHLTAHHPDEASLRIKSVTVTVPQAAPTASAFEDDDEPPKKQRRSMVTPGNRKLAPKIDETNFMTASVPEYVPRRSTGPNNTNVNGAASGGGLSAPYPFHCHLCDYKTLQKTNFDRHIAYHEDLKMFKCSVCGYRCNFKWDMNKHCKLVHSMVPDAHTVEMTLEEARESLSDYRVQSGKFCNTSFRCSVCHYEAPRRRLLERHLKQEHAENPDAKIEGCLGNNGSVPGSPSTGTPQLPPQQRNKMYQCSVCGLRSTWKKSIKGHLQTQHPNSGGAILVLSGEGARVASETPGPKVPPIPKKPRDSKDASGGPLTHSNGRGRPPKIPNHALPPLPLSSSAVPVGEPMNMSTRAEDLAPLPQWGESEEEESSVLDFSKKSFTIPASALRQANSLPHSDSPGREDEDDDDEDANLEMDLPPLEDDNEEDDEKQTDRNVTPTSTSQLNDSSSLQSPNSRSFRVKSTCRRFKCPSCYYRANLFHDVKKHISNTHKNQEANPEVLEEEYARQTLEQYIEKFAYNRGGRYGRQYGMQVMSKEEEELHKASGAIIVQGSGESRSSSSPRIAPNLTDITPPIIDDGVGSFSGDYSSPTNHLKPPTSSEVLDLSGGSHEKPDSAMVLPSDDSISCRLCSFDFSNELSRQIHILGHRPSDSRLLSCQQCFYSVKNTVHLTHHKISSHNKTVNSLENAGFCAICPFKTDSHVELVQHITQGHCPDEQSRFACNNCSFWSSNLIEMNAHTVLHGKSGAFTQLTPGRNAIPALWRDDLVRNHYFPGGHLFACSDCPFVTFSEESLAQNHASKHESCEEDSGSNEAKLRCQFCGFSEDSPDKLAKHETLHDDAKFTYPPQRSIDWFELAIYCEQEEEPTPSERHPSTSPSPSPQTVGMSAPQWQCKLCKEVFDDETVVKDHLFSQHVPESLREYTNTESMIEKV